MCEDGWGGKNCSVALIGCNQNRCQNGGNCVPWLVGEDDHRYNCTCLPGFDGQFCQHRTTFSLSGDSYIKVPSTRAEGYELHMKFRTTLGNGLLAIGQANTLFRLQLLNGKLNLYSNLVSRYDGITIGENLNNTEWQKVYVAVNATHLTLGVNDRLQNNEPINPNGDSDTVFYNTYFGGIDSDQKILARNAPNFTGCMQDIIVDGMKITEEDFLEGGERDVEEVNTSPDCIRKEQCKPNPCHNNGICKDLWNSFQCTCHRPFLGPSCEFNYTGGTFGHEDTTDSLAIVDIDNPALYSSGVDISMFIRTRKQDGFIFYFGSDLATPGQPKSFITGQLSGSGNLVVNVSFDGTTEKFQVYTENLSDGYRHFIRVARMKNSMMVIVNETVSINHEIPSPNAFTAQKLYLGNYPDLATITTTTTTTTTSTSTTQLVSTQRFSPPATSQLSTTSKPSSISPRRLDSVVQRVTTTTEANNPAAAAAAAAAAATGANNGIFDEADMLVDNTEEVEEAASDFSSGNGIVRRQRKRRSAIVEAEELVEDNRIETENVKKVPYFKGVIQDVQIRNGREEVRIIELFNDNFDSVTVQKPESIGKVQLMAVEQGVVSDDACAVNPCQNGGTCHVTWNDFHCQCQEGYRGRNCADKEYCFWYDCPVGSTCKSLVDGHECISNATFNGVNSTYVAYPQFSIDEETVNSTSVGDNEIVIYLRTRSLSGTLLQINNNNANANGEFIRLSLSGEKVVIEVPEMDGKMHSYFLDFSQDKDDWHRLHVTFYNGIVSAFIDQESPKEVTIDFPPNLSLLDFVQQSSILVGSSLTSQPRRNSDVDLYNVDLATTLTPAAAGALIFNQVDQGFSDFFRGCLGQVRIAGILVPFFNENELINNSASQRFDIDSRMDVTPNECVLCYEHECLNGGSCANPNEEFQCSCKTGFSGSLCATNIDECLSNLCKHGQCVDAVANYTCACDPGWTGWLCDEDLDECLSGPCLHGGFCQQTLEPGNYTCDCTDQYKGQNCEQKRNRTCADNPCKHGQCYDEQSKSLKIGNRM